MPKLFIIGSHRCGMSHLAIALALAGEVRRGVDRHPVVSVATGPAYPGLKSRDVEADLLAAIKSPARPPDFDCTGVNSTSYFEPALKHHPFAKFINPRHRQR